MRYGVYNSTKSQWEYSSTLNPIEVCFDNPGDTPLAGSLHPIGPCHDHDFLYLRKAFIDYVDGLPNKYADLTDAEMENACKVFAVVDGNGNIDVATINTFYIGTLGLTAQQATDRITAERRNFQTAFLHNTDNRANSPVMKAIMVHYLNNLDINDYIKTVSDLVYRYSKFGIMGQAYGDEPDGLLDHIESTNGYAGAGLTEKGYTLKTGTISALVADLVAWLVNGVKPTYF